jgi:hypothetical protein
VTNKLIGVNNHNEYVAFLFGKLKITSMSSMREIPNASNNTDSVSGITESLG